MERPLMTALTRHARIAAAALATLVSLAGCNLQITNQAEARDEWKKTYPLAAGGTLEIRNTNGLIQIDPSDGATVEVVAERIVKASTDQAAKDALAQLEIREQVAPDKVVLDSTAHFGGVSIMFGGNREVRYHVRAPRSTNVYLVTTNGTIDVRGLTGTFHAEATNGKIVGSGLSNTATVETTNGTINLDVAALGGDGLSCTTTNGSVTVVVPRDAKARLSARVTNGGISTEGLTLGNVEQSRRRLDATLGGGGTAIRLETTNGAIVVKGK
jgi:hypothetical protein